MRLFSSVCVLALTLALTGCVNVTQVTGPNGEPSYSLNCGSDMSACHKKAGELCPKGYLNLDQTTGEVAIPSRRSFIMAPVTYLLIQCK